MIFYFEISLLERFNSRVVAAILITSSIQPAGKKGRKERERREGEGREGDLMDPMHSGPVWGHS